MCFTIKAINNGKPEEIEVHLGDSLDEEKLRAFTSVVSNSNFSRAEYLVFAHMITLGISETNAADHVVVENVTDAEGNVSTFRLAEKTMEVPAGLPN